MKEITVSFLSHLIKAIVYCSYNMLWSYIKFMYLSLRYFIFMLCPVQQII